MKPFALLFPGMSGPPENMMVMLFWQSVTALVLFKHDQLVETPKCGNVSIERGLGKVLVNGIKVHSECR